MSRKFEYALDESLVWMRAGASIESCLNRFPDFAETLRPLLELATSVRQVENPQSPQAAVQQSRQQMFAAVDQKFSKQPVSKSLLSRYAQQIITRITGKENLDMKLIARFAFAMIVAILFISASGTAIASAQAIPGDTLYPVKTMLEEVKLNLTLNDISRQQLEERLQKTRREEILAVIQVGRIVDVHYWGELTAINENSWEVSGLIINMDANTQIMGEPVLGSYVVVKATTQEDGTILAYKLIVNGPYTNEGSLYPDPQGIYTQQWIRNHEQFRDGTHEPAFTPMPGHDQAQDRDRDRNQTCDLMQDPACEPFNDQDQDRDRTHDQSNDPTYEYEPTWDQNHNRNHDQNYDSAHESSHKTSKPDHRGGH